MANPALTSLAARQQVMLERYKSGEVQKIEAFLMDAAKVIRERLASGELTEFGKARAEQQIAAIARDLNAIYSDAAKQLELGLNDYADYASGAEARALESIATVDFARASATQIYAAAIARPLGNGKTATMLEPFISGWSESSVSKVENAIRLGYFQGKTNAEITREIVGTKGNQYRDGIIDSTYQNAKAVVRTSIQHVAQVAKDETFRANADIIDKYEWVSVLDNRTTQQCQSLSGREFEVGKGPLPPLHIGCRASVVAVINNKFIRDSLKEGATQSSKGAEGGQQVPADLTYYEWLKTQPAGFQDEAIGPVRGQLLRDGGLTAERFAELQLGKNFEPLTLDQMRKIEPLAFEKAGL